MNNAYDEGFQAFRQGLVLADNPYQGENEKKRQWDAGWEDAKIETDLKKRSICADKP
ncbi:MAG: hypothetical protein HUU20_24270 [Pirellulales bacterium]|nr:hypothetical protein [Pirellulales bacterium]